MPRIGFPICSNEKCFSLPFIGTALKVIVKNSNEDLYCRKCKHTFDKEVLGSENCPICKIKLVAKKIRFLKCPKCGRNY